MRWRLAILMLGAWAARGAADEVRTSFLSAAEPSSPPVVSVSQRFVFRGFDRRDGTRLAAWTEDIAARLERRMGLAIPFHRFDMIRIEGATDAREPSGGVFVGQGMSNGSLQQRVVVANPDRIEAEALLEGMVQVLLNRYVSASRDAGGEVPQRSLVPDWLSVGVAQGLREDLRQRNRDYVVKNWRAGSVPPATAVLDMRTLPSGRAPQKAFCGLLVDWLEHACGGHTLWPALLDALARDALDAKWVADQAPGVDGERALNQAWDVWLAEVAASRQIMGKLGFEEVAQLKSLLDIRLIDYGLAPVADLPARFAPRDLIEHKNEDWARTVALRLFGKLREARIGQAPEWAAVADQYMAFFAGFNEGVLGSGSISATRLSRRLDDAERGMTLLEKTVALQAHYLNNVEQREVESPVVDEPPPPLDDQRRRFLDSIEQQYQQGDRP